MAALRILVSSMALLTMTRADIICYHTNSSSGNMPNSNTVTGREWTDYYSKMVNENVENFLEPRLCVKSYSRTYFKHNGNEQTLVQFSWAPSNPRYSDTKVVSCSDVIEASIAIRLYGVDAEVYSHECFCCGDRCNGKNMEDMCNEPPVFAKQCYSAGVQEIITTDKLPDDSRIVPATETQFCYKASYLNSTSGEYRYTWGGISLEPGQQCGDTRAMFLGAGVADAITCCDSLCNG